MACACGKKNSSSTLSYTVIAPGGTLYGPYRARSEADAVAGRHPGSVVRSSGDAAE